MGPNISLIYKFNSRNLLKGPRSRLFHNGFRRFYWTHGWNLTSHKASNLLPLRGMTGGALKSINYHSNVHFCPILLCYCNEHEWVSYERVVDRLTHHLRLWIIHHRQQVSWSSCFFPSPEVNRISWPLSPFFKVEKHKTKTPPVDQMWFKAPRCVTAGVMGAGGGVNTAVLHLPAVTRRAHKLKYLRLSASEWRTPPTWMNGKPAPCAKIVKCFIASSYVYLPTHFSRKSHPKAESIADSYKGDVTFTVEINQ